MWLLFLFVFIYFGIVSSQRRRGWILGKRRTLILTTAAIIDLSQEKLLYHMVYFWMTGGSQSFILLKASAGVFLALSFFSFMIFFFLLVCRMFFIFKIPINMKDSTFSCVQAMNSFLFCFSLSGTCFFRTWECWLKQILTVHGNPFYQKDKTQSKLYGQMPLYGGERCQFSQTMPWVIYHLLSFKVSPFYRSFEDRNVYTLLTLHSCMNNLVSYVHTKLEPFKFSQIKHFSNSDEDLDVDGVENYIVKVKVILIIPIIMLLNCNEAEKLMSKANNPNYLSDL